MSLIPQIRFTGYTDNWKQLKLGYISQNTFGGGTPKTTVIDYWQGSIPWIQSSDLITDKLFNVSPKKNITSEAVKNSATKIIPENSIAIVTRVGVGKLAFMPYEYATSQDFLSLSNLTTDYNFSVYSIYKMLKRELHSIQGTSIKGITKTELLDKIIAVPNLAEQQKIGAIFKQLDDTITLHQRQLELLKEQKKGFLQKMFPQNGANKPEIRFSDFTDDWEQRKFGEIVDLKSGRDYKHLNDGDIPVYGTGGYMLSVDQALSYAENAIGIGRKGTIDKPYLLKAPFWTVDTLFYALPLQNNDLNFIYTLFQNVNWKMYDESTGVPSLSKAVINKVIASIPSLNEQQKIGAFFKQLDDTIALHQRKLELLKEQKKGFLQKMFV